jgi:hypothetical protein
MALRVPVVVGLKARSRFTRRARKPDSKGHFDIADRDWALESLCLLEVAIGLALGDGTTPGQLVGSLRPMLIPLQKGAGQVEPLGLLDMVGARHLTYLYVCLCHTPKTS